MLSQPNFIHFLGSIVMVNSFWLPRKDWNLFCFIILVIAGISILHRELKIWQKSVVFNKNVVWWNFRKDSEQTKQTEELQKQNEELVDEKERLLEEIERIVSESGKIC